MSVLDRPHVPGAFGKGHTTKKAYRKSKARAKGRAARAARKARSKP